MVDIFLCHECGQPVEVGGVKSSSLARHSATIHGSLQDVQKSRYNDAGRIAAARQGFISATKIPLQSLRYKRFH